MEHNPAIAKMRAFLKEKYSILTEDEISLFLKHHSSIKKEDGKLKIFTALSIFFKDLSNRAGAIHRQLNERVVDVERRKMEKAERLSEVKKSLQQMKSVLEIANLPIDYNRGVSFIENILFRFLSGDRTCDHNPLVNELAYDVLKACGYKSEESNGRIFYKYPENEPLVSIRKVLELVRKEFLVENFRAEDAQPDLSLERHRTVIRSNHGVIRDLSV